MNSAKNISVACKGNEVNLIIFIFRVCWGIASLAAVPYMLFTDINYIDDWQGKVIKESAFCTLFPHKTQVC